MEIESNDSRGNQPDFIKTKRKETQRMQQCQVWSVAKEQDISADASVMGGRLILTLKNYLTPNEQAKVRYIEQGYRDRDNPFLVYDASPLRISSIRMLLSVPSVLDFRLFIRDVTQAY